MKLLAVASLLICSSLPVDAAGVYLRVRPLDAGRVMIEARGVAASAAIRAIAVHLDRPVDIAADASRTIDLGPMEATPAEGLIEVAEKAGLAVERLEQRWVIRDPAEPTVTIDVVDLALPELARHLSSQCGIRNVMIRPGTTGRGTFRFDSVPCSTALQVVSGSLGLRFRLEPNSILVIGGHR